MYSPSRVSPSLPYPLPNLGGTGATAAQGVGPVMELQTTPMDFAGHSAVMYQWHESFAILTYPQISDPHYVIHHGHEQVRFIGYADALDYVGLLATGGCIAVKASPAPAQYSYRREW